MPETHDEYLGDGVYASFDGCHVCLDLRGQDDSTRIALEPSVFENLLRYKTRMDTLAAATEEARANG